jgi:hypothetical protein
VVEHILDYIYLGTGALGRFDKFSHMLPTYLLAGTCQVYAEKPAAGCSGNYGGGSAAAAKRAKKSAAPAKADANTQALDYLLGK